MIFGEPRLLRFRKALTLLDGEDEMGGLFILFCSFSQSAVGAKIVPRQPQCKNNST
jgi:hypothetical protein